MSGTDDDQIAEDRERYFEFVERRVVPIAEAESTYHSQAWHSLLSGVVRLEIGAAAAGLAFTIGFMPEQADWFLFTLLGGALCFILSLYCNYEAIRWLVEHHAIEAIDARRWASECFKVAHGDPPFVVPPMIETTDEGQSALKHHEQWADRGRVLLLIAAAVTIGAFIADRLAG